MNNAQLRQEIKDMNLTYLMLAQAMLRADRTEAIYRLGITEPVGDIIASLSGPQLVKAAASNMLMCRFRFDDEMVWGLITSHGKEPAVGAGLHAQILMAGRERPQATH